MLAIACWGYLLTLLAVWLFLRQGGDRWWPATVLLFAPRWPLMVPATALWPFVIAARRWRLAWVLTAASSVLLGPLLGLRVALPAGSGEPAHLRLLTCNIHRQQLDAEQLAAFIAATQPDVVALQDWSSVHHGRLFAGGGWDVRQAGELLVASRFPIAGVTRVNLRETAAVPGMGRGGAAACYELQTPRGRVRLINVHLVSPHAALLSLTKDRGRKLSENTIRRWRESAALREVVNASSGPILLVGDFNTTDDSPIFREHWPDFVNAFDTGGSGIGYTYLNRRTQLRIDHVLAGPGWQPVRCWVGPAVGSPHRPLVADLRFR